MDIESAALSVLQRANGEPVYLIGRNIGTGQQDDQSKMVLSTCDNCDAPVESTEVKEKIRSLSITAQLYCEECMKELMTNTLWQTRRI